MLFSEKGSIIISHDYHGVILAKKPNLCSGDPFGLAPKIRPSSRAWRSLAVHLTFAGLWHVLLYIHLALPNPFTYDPYTSKLPLLSSVSPWWKVYVLCTMHSDNFCAVRWKLYALCAVTIYVQQAVPWLTNRLYFHGREPRFQAKGAILRGKNYLVKGIGS